MNDRPATAPSDPDSREKITPLIENAILELALLIGKMITTPFAVLLFTKDFRGQIAALGKDEPDAHYSPTVARPLSFYVLWMAVHFLLASSYWHYFLREKSQLRDAANNVPEQIKRASKFLQDMSGLTGRVEALIIIAFAVILIIAVKSALVTVIGRSIGCPIRFRTVLQASAYAIGTLLFFQYAFIMLHYSIDAIFGDTHSRALGYYVLIYGSLLICIVLTARVNQVIRALDDTRETPTFVSWLTGTIIWMYLIILVSRPVLQLDLTIVQFMKAFGNALIPRLFQL